jgi:predicted transcriptional regulator
MSQHHAKNRTAVTFDLPDELVQELVSLGMERNVSVRQFIREAVQDLARRSQTEPTAMMTVVAEKDLA